MEDSSINDSAEEHNSETNTSFEVDQEYCSDCGKPLGSTIDKCHECGGKTPRGSRITADKWQAAMGVLHIRMQREQS
jgi:predicted amidophosphoribosyltransferase